MITDRRFPLLVGSLTWEKKFSVELVSMDLLTMEEVCSLLIRKRLTPLSAITAQSDLSSRINLPANFRIMEDQERSCYFESKHVNRESTHRLSGKRSHITQVAFCHYSGWPACTVVYCSFYAKKTKACLLSNSPPHELEQPKQVTTKDKHFSSRRLWDDKSLGCGSQTFQQAQTLAIMGTEHVTFQLRTNHFAAAAAEAPVPLLSTWR